MDPAARKQRVVIAIVSAVIALAFLGNFFWMFGRDFFHSSANGGKASPLPLLIFGGVFLLMALAIVFSVTRGLRKMSETPPPAPGDAFPREPQPWLARSDWATGRIKSTVNAQTKILVLFALAFGGFGGFMTYFILPSELHKGNRLALLVLIFPAVGLIMTITLVRQLLARRRFGDCFFELASIPAPLGGTLEGQILVGARLRLEQGLHLKLSCIRRTVSRSGDGNSVNEAILWQDEKVLRLEAGLPEPEPGRSGIPVFFKIPASQPECFARGNETILWRLEAKTKMSGPDFSAAFEVPVFKVGSVAIANDDALEKDPTATLQETVEDFRRDEKSRIRLTDGPEGREFYFPAARNPGFASSLTLFLVIWTGAVWLMLHLRAPIMFPIIFGLIDVLIFWGCINVWFKSSRVTINPSGITLQNHWLVFSRSRQFAASEIARFDTKVGMTSGSTAYHDIKLVTHDLAATSFEAQKSRQQQTGERPQMKLRMRDANGVTLAGAVASSMEAKWLVQEMTRALGRAA